jgi:hypothetical protein
MADDDKWGRNIDKIAYGAAGIVGIIVLMIPFVFGGQIRDGECSAEVETLRDRIERQPAAIREALQKGQDEPVLKDLLAKQWTVGPAVSHDPVWVTELQPVLIRKTPQKAQEVPVHVAGKVTEVSCDRDPAKKVPFLVVKGSAGEGNQHVVIRKAALLRKEGEGAFAPVPAFTALSADGSFEFKDYTVEPGKTYAYQLRTTVARDGKAPAEVKALDPKEAEKTSDPLGPTPPVPHEFWLSISSFQGPDAANPQAKPRFFGKLKYWDYKAGKAADLGGGAVVQLEEGAKFAGDRFELLFVLANESKVVVRDNEKQVKEEIIEKASRDPRPVAPWPPVVPAAPAPEGGEAVEEPAEEETKAKPAKAAPKAPAPKAGADKTKDKAKAKPKPKAAEETRKKRQFK